MKSEYNCYKLFGFDVFIDQDLKPWIIEVWQQKSITIFRAGHASFVPRPRVTRETVKLSLLQRSKFRRGWPLSSSRMKNPATFQVLGFRGGGDGDIKMTDNYSWWRGYEEKLRVPSSAFFQIFFFYNKKIRFQSVPFNYRRRINTEEKAKVVTANWGTKFIQFLATLAVLNYCRTKNMMNGTRITWRKGWVQNRPSEK